MPLFSFQYLKKNCFPIEVKYPERFFFNSMTLFNANIYVHTKRVASRKMKENVSQLITTANLTTNGYLLKRTKC